MSQRCAAKTRAANNLTNMQELEALITKKQFSQ